MPLADHPHPFIVEDEDLHRQAILADRPHFLDVHLERGFARDADDEAVRVRDLRADRGGETIAHRAEPARREPAIGGREAEMLRRPHLVLADLGRDDRIAAARRVEQRLHRALRHDFGAVLLLFGEVEAARRAPAVDTAPPFAIVTRLEALVLPRRDQRIERAAGVADHREVDGDDLVDRAAVDIDVDLLRFGREGIEAAGHAVVEARADRDDQVGAVHRHVRFERAVHPQHPEPLRIVGGEGAEAHQRRGDRRAGEADELAQRRAGIRPGVDDAAAGVEDRPLGRGDHVDRGGNRVGVGFDLRAVAVVLDEFGHRIGAGRDLHILRNVDHHGAGTPVRRDMERLVHDRAETVGVHHEIIVLGAVARDAHRVAFLEGVGADQRRRDLTGQHDHRNGIEQRVGDAGDGIGRAGARGDEYDAGLAGRARIALCRVGCRLFVADEDVLDRRVLVERVIDGKDRAARIAEHRIDPEVDQRLNHHVGTTHFRHDETPFFHPADRQRTRLVRCSRSAGNRCMILSCQQSIT